MKRLPLSHFLRRPVITGFFLFAALFVLTQSLTYQRYLLLKETRQRELTNQTNRTKERLQAVINYSYSTTKTLAFLVENYGIPSDFEHVAQQLLKVNPTIDMVELVKGGVITHVYPLKGNEGVIGFNILLDSARNSGAITTIEKRDFFVAGPIHLKQGGIGFVSRVPYYINNQFQGFSAAVIKLSTLLNEARIDTSGHGRFSYQLAKINAATGKEEFFLQQSTSFRNDFFVTVDIPNGEWKLYVSDVSNTGYTALFIFAFLGFLLSITGGLFAWYIAKQPSRLNKLVQEQTFLLRSSEQKYKSTIDSITDAFLTIDTNGCCTYMNVKAGKLLRLDPEKMVGNQIRGELRERMGESFYRVFYQAIEEQRPVYTEGYYPSYERWFASDIYPSQEGVSIFFKDITKKKTEEKELKEANQRVCRQNKVDFSLESISVV